MNVVNNYTDQELLEGVKQFEERAANRLYENHKDRCIKLMYKYGFKDENAVEDIYQDAVIVLIENVRNKNFELTCTIQTYLNTICLNQMRTRFKDMKKKAPMLMGDDVEVREDINDWFTDLEALKEERMEVMLEELEKLRKSAGADSPCPKILEYYYFNKKTMLEIADLMKYSDAVSARNQKMRCQNTLKMNVRNRFQ